MNNKNLSNLASILYVKTFKAMGVVLRIFIWSRASIHNLSSDCTNHIEKVGHKGHLKLIEHTDKRRKYFFLDRRVNEALMQTVNVL